jgi:hypothetical protein
VLTPEEEEIVFYIDNTSAWSVMIQGYTSS